MSGHRLIAVLLLGGAAAAAGVALYRDTRPPATEQAPPAVADSPSAALDLSPAVTIDPNLVKRTFRPGRLYLPTAIEKLDGQYFVVDCYNNRVLYSSDLAVPISDWQVLDDQLSRPHSIASDGRYFVVDDTEAHRIKVYQREGEGFSLIQSIGNVGSRPHRVRYDPATKAFYVLASTSQAITKLVAGNDGLEVSYTRKLPFLGSAYTRSFSIMDGNMVFVSGPGVLTIAEYDDDSYRLLQSLAVPDEYRSMNDLMRIGDAYYISASLNRMLRCESLTDLPESRCRSVYDQLPFRGNPYYFSRFDGNVYVTELTGRDDILMFQVNGSDLVFNKALFTVD